MIPLWNPFWEQLNHLVGNINYHPSFTNPQAPLVAQDEHLDHFIATQHTLKARIVLKGKHKKSETDNVL